MPIRKDKDLMSIFSELLPKKLSNGQIRTECPFQENHRDGSGRMSFFVSPDINAYHCFSCGAKGNLVKMLTTKFKVGYFTAVSLVRLTDHTPEKKEFDLDIYWDFRKSPKSFTDRGFSPELLKKFRVGTMTDEKEVDWDVIPFYKDFNEPKELLGYQRRNDFRGERVVRNGKNFDKKSYLYNLDYGYTYTILVEGYSDVWRLLQHGYNATALLGTSLSEAQANLLAEYDRVYIALDNDLPGRKAVEWANYLLSKRTEVLFVPYETKDPGECKSKREWERAFAASTDYVVYSMEMAINWDGYLEMRDSVLKHG